MKEIKVIKDGIDVAASVTFRVIGGELVPFDNEGNNLKGQAFFVEAAEWLDPAERAALKRKIQNIKKLSIDLASDAYEATGQEKSAAYYDASNLLDTAIRRLESLMELTPAECPFNE